MLHTKRLVRLTAIALIFSLCAFPVQAHSNQSAPAAEISAQEAVGPAQRTVSVVHYKPYYGSFTLGGLENGTRLTVLGTTNEFYKIDCYGMVGYLEKSQVQLGKDGQYYVRTVSDANNSKTVQTFSAQDALTVRSQIRSIALRYLGVPYVYGGTSPYGFDCSGLVQYVFRQAGISLNRTCDRQMANGIAIAKEDLQCGDLVVFQNTTGWGHFSSHIGVYIGNNQIVHAGTGGVGIMNLYEAYAMNHYQGAIRIISTDLPQTGTVPSVGIHKNMNSSFWRESSQTEESGNFFVESLASKKDIVYNKSILFDA